MEEDLKEKRSHLQRPATSVDLPQASSLYPLALRFCSMTGQFLALSAASDAVLVYVTFLSCFESNVKLIMPKGSLTDSHQEVSEELLVPYPSSKISNFEGDVRGDQVSHSMKSSDNPAGGYHCSISL